jgi:NADPH:quinone reductase-like Zn-dependent oxidoreductase
MRAIVYDRFGGPDVLHQADMPVPKPGPTEVLVQVAYAAVNPVDWKIREGHMKDSYPYEFPIIPGWDASGIVIGAGTSVSLYKQNDKVYAYCRKPVIHAGAYAEFITLDESMVSRMPRNFGFKDSAAIPLAGLTAWQALVDIAKVQPGETVLVHAGAGGVGGYGIQIAKNIGAGVLTTASLRNHELVRSYGADVAIDYAREDFVQTILNDVKGGVDVVFDLLGGDITLRSIRALKRGGRLVSSVGISDEAMANANGKNVKASQFLVQPSGRQLAEMAILFEEGRLRVPPLREYDLRDAAAAQSLSQTGHIQGKIVLKVK